jgi:hypothetical protein
MRELLRDCHESLRRVLDPDALVNRASSTKHPHATKLPEFEVFEMAEAMQDELLRSLGRGELLRPLLG